MDSETATLDCLDLADICINGTCVAMTEECGWGSGSGDGDDTCTSCMEHCADLPDFCLDSETATMACLEFHDMCINGDCAECWSEPEPEVPACGDLDKAGCRERDNATFCTWDKRSRACTPVTRTCAEMAGSWGENFGRRWCCEGGDDACTIELASDFDTKECEGLDCTASECCAPEEQPEPEVNCRRIGKASKCERHSTCMWLTSAGCIDVSPPEPTTEEPQETYRPTDPPAADCSSAPTGKSCNKRSGCTWDKRTRACDRGSRARVRRCQEEQALPSPLRVDRCGRERTRRIVHGPDNAPGAHVRRCHEEQALQLPLRVDRRTPRSVLGTGNHRRLREHRWQQNLQEHGRLLLGQAGLGVRVLGRRLQRRQRRGPG